MRRKNTRPSTLEAYHSHVQRRLVDLLLALAPDAPVPLILLQEALGTESVTDGPLLSPADMWSVFDNVALVPYALDIALSAVEWLPGIERNEFRDTLTVGSSAHEVLRQHAAALDCADVVGRPMRECVSPLISLTVEMYGAASFHPEDDADTFSLDQLALLVPHLLHLIEAECNDEDEGWGPIQSLATLWLLNDHGVVALNDVDDYTHRIMAYCEPRYREWNAALAVEMLTQTVGEMIVAEWEEAATIGKRALAMAEDILQRVHDADERARYTAAIANWRIHLDLR